MVRGFDEDGYPYYDDDYYEEESDSPLAANRSYVTNDSIILGTDIQTQKPLLVTQENLESGFYCLGVQGVGKSSLLQDIIQQELRFGSCVIVLDPHGDLVRDVIARMPASRLQDTYLLDLAEARDWPFGMNLFALPKGQEDSRPAKDAVRNQVMHAFEKLWPETRTGLYFGNVLRPVISTLIENQELTLAHVPRLFYHDAFRIHYTKQLKNIEAQEFWGEYSFWSRSKRERYIDPLLDRIKKLLSDELVRSIICQKHAKLDLASVIRQQKVMLLRLPLRDPAYEYTSPVIGTFFTTLLQGAIFGVSKPHERTPCTLVIDEFQNFVTEDNERFWSEGRKYRVKQILAHQYMSQLDRDGLTTMKAAATSAYTIVSFRTNKDDSSTMASLFSGLPRKPTDIYIDVLSHLDDAKNHALVKEFYWDTVRPLQLASKLHEERKTGELPSYNFGFGMAIFEPSLVTSTLNHLNSLLYYAQKDGYSNERLLQSFWDNFLLLNKNVAYVDVEDSENMRRIRDIEQQIKALERIANAEHRVCTVEQTKESTQQAIKFAADMEKRGGGITLKEADDEPFSSLEQKVADYIKYFPFWIPDKINAINQRMKAIQLQLEELHRQRDKQYRELLKKHGYSEYAWRSVAWQYGIDDYITTGRGLQRRLQVPQYFERDTNGDIALVFTESKEYTRLNQEHRLLKHVNFHYDHEEEKSRDDARSAKRDLEKAKGNISPTRKVENSRILEYKRHVQRVIETLIEQPLTADNASFSSAEIANTLQQQPNRQAYVKTASTVSQMHTRDLNEQFPLALYTETNNRRNRILKQTKDTYCRGRATVEQEIASVYEISLPSQEETKVPEKRDLEKETEGDKKRHVDKTKQQYVKQQDIFDKLDADGPVD